MKTRSERALRQLAILGVVSLLFFLLVPPLAARKSVLSAREWLSISEQATPAVKESLKQWKDSLEAASRSTASSAPREDLLLHLKRYEQLASDRDNFERNAESDLFDAMLFQYLMVAGVVFSFCLIAWVAKLQKQLQLRASALG